MAPDITPIETSNTFEVALGNGAGIHAQNGMLTVYAMMAPAAVAGKEIVLSLEDTAGETVFSDNISFSANIAKGKAAYITCGTQNVHNGHEYVDLGITDANGSPVYWATCNIGATKPEDFGLYFAWGEVVGHTKNDGRVFDWASYRFMQDGYSDQAHITKYSNHGEETSLDIADDAAYRNWGGSWRMPTKEELEQLHTNCNWDETTINGVKGYKVSSKSDPSKYIFLPAAEEWSEYDYLEYFNGNYWSGTFDATEKLPYAMWWSTEIGWQGVAYHYQYYGLSLRAVCSFSTPAPAPFVNVSSINITGSTQKIYGDSSLKLTASVLPSDATNPTIEWYSSDPSVATVSNSGLVTGVNEGSVTITAKAADGSEVIATYEITVSNVEYSFAIINAGFKYLAMPTYTTEIIGCNSNIKTVPNSQYWVIEYLDEEHNTFNIYNYGIYLRDGEKKYLYTNSRSYLSSSTRRSYYINDEGYLTTTSNNGSTVIVLMWDSTLSICGETSMPSNNYTRVWIEKINNINF